MTFFRSIALNTAFYAFFLVAAILGLPFLIAPKGALMVARIWATINLWLLKTIGGITLEVRGREKLPKGGCIIAAKHQSALETFGIVPFVGDFAFILKRELNWIPLFGWYTTRAGMIGVNRGARSQALRDMTVEAKKAIANGRQIIIYPEGTRRPPGAPPAYKFGPVHLYSQLDTVVVPVAVNTGLYWPRRSFLRYPGTAVLEFLDPIPPGLDGEAFKERLETVIEEASNRLMAEARARGEGIPPHKIKPPK
ncbi:1-acyl-sn-glycerol-3-phosphate acyltransferase [Terrihabitans soli]|uniref:1-acyl-sn-glycerol-3-phosphate acyltransferase n=1 Tax=Terrihabitans soli TaxID=708113 RepID=A0A6S6QR78_9HYPH|nr:lysophospholipid acyltransferase family protein [Terrihabitans soli]BCJ89551.1 1-acyl-sn-glycerol-3-phosphate acyltransferase [Terrihabitans soli]